MPIHTYKRKTHPYHTYHHRHHVQTGRKKWPWVLLSTVVLAVAVVAGFLAIRPLPLIAPQQQALALAPSSSPSIAWPKKSQAAFGTVSQGVLESKNGQKILPTASTIKLLTVLTILDKKPLALGQQGPLIPITQADVDIYNTYYAENGSLAQVRPGEKISQYQMIEGILIPSANNYADSLAIWAYGSLANYQKASQAMAARLGMTKTTVGLDASGFSPGSASTATDLTRLGIAAIQNPVVAQIVAKKQIELPVEGVKQNTNWSLSQKGLIGIKTGNTDQAGGVFVFAAKQQIDPTHSVTIVGAVQGETTVNDAIIQSLALLKRVRPHFKVVTSINKDQTLASYLTPWGAATTAVAGSDIKIVTWPGKQPPPQFELKSIAATSTAQAKIGTVKVGDQSSSILLSKKLPAPRLSWRLFGAWGK